MTLIPSFTPLIIATVEPPKTLPRQPGSASEAKALAAELNAGEARRREARDREHRSVLEWIADQARRAAASTSSLTHRISRSINIDAIYGARNHPRADTTPDPSTPGSSTAPARPRTFSALARDYYDGSVREDSEARLIGTGPRGGAR